MKSPGHAIRVLIVPVVIIAIIGTVAFAGAAQQAAKLPFNSDHSDFDPESVKTFSAFPLYYAGDSFDGLPLTAITRRLQTTRLEPEPGRANFVGFLYGDCEPVSDGGCPLPLEIQVWPACERTLASYTMGGQPMAHDRTTLRGVPAAIFDNGGRLELYTGRVTVVIFGMSKEQMERATDALVPVNFDAETADDLPMPDAGALEGKLTCTSQENGSTMN